MEAAIDKFHCELVLFKDFRVPYKRDALQTGSAQQSQLQLDHKLTLPVVGTLNLNIQRFFHLHHNVESLNNCFQF